MGTRVRGFKAYKGSRFTKGKRKGNRKVPSPYLFLLAGLFGLGGIYELADKHIKVR